MANYKATQTPPSLVVADFVGHGVLGDMRHMTHNEVGPLAKSQLWDT